MAIEVFSEISSPRISFSHNLNDAEAIEEHHHHNHQRLDTSLLDSDFSFGNNSFVQECLSAADELFSNGKILPIQIKKDPVVVEKQVHRRPEPVPSPPPSPQAATDNATKKRLKEFLSMSMDEDDKPALKSFWQFKRCTSLNSETSTRSKSLMRPLQFLSRSNSTGSAPNPKPTMLSKETRKQPYLSRKSSVSSSSSSSGAFYTYSHSAQKPPCGGYGNGVRVGSVLNLPHPLICNASLFGSRFCNGKAKRKKT